MTRYHGYTLIELLFAITLFSALLGVIFSVFGAVRRAEQFRDANVAVTQAASFAFEPITRTLKQANATERVRFADGQCRTVRGFYIAGPDGVTDMPQIDGQNLLVSDAKSSVLVAITAEPQFDARQNGLTYRWVKHEYRHVNNTIEESVFVSVNAWPTPLDSCTTSSWRDEAETTERLVPHSVRPIDQVNVTQLSARIVTPVLVAEVPLTFQTQPYVSLVLKVEPARPRPGVSVAPLTLTSTIVPNSVYGEVRQ